MQPAEQADDPGVVRGHAPDGSFEGGDRLARTPGPFQGDPEIGPHVDVPGSERRRLAPCLHLFLVPPGEAKEGCEVRPPRKVAGGVLHRGAVRRLRVGRAAELAFEVAEVVPAGRVARIGLGRPAVARQGVLVPPLRTLGVAEPHPGRGRLRSNLGGKPVGLLGLLRHPPALQHHREGETGLELARRDRAGAPEAGLRVGRAAELREGLTRRELDPGIAGSELVRLPDEPEAGLSFPHAHEGEAGVQASRGMPRKVAHGRARRIEGVTCPVLGEGALGLREAAARPLLRLAAHPPSSPVRGTPGRGPGPDRGTVEPASPTRARDGAVSRPPPGARTRPPGREDGRTRARSRRSAGAPRPPTARRTARRCSGSTPAIPRRHGGSPSPT